MIPSSFAMNFPLNRFRNHLVRRLCLDGQISCEEKYPWPSFCSFVFLFQSHICLWHVHYVTDTLLRTLSVLHVIYYFLLFAGRGERGTGGEGAELRAYRTSCFRFPPLSLVISTSLCYFYFNLLHPTSRIPPPPPILSIPPPPCTSQETAC